MCREMALFTGCLTNTLFVEGVSTEAASSHCSASASRSLSVAISAYAAHKRSVTRRDGQDLRGIRRWEMVGFLVMTNGMPRVGYWCQMVDWMAQFPGNRVRLAGGPGTAMSAPGRRHGSGEILHGCEPARCNRSRAAAAHRPNFFVQGPKARSWMPWLGGTEKLKAAIRIKQARRLRSSRQDRARAASGRCFGGN